MGIVLHPSLDRQLGAQALGKLRGKADLHGAAIGLPVVESNLNTLAVFHRDDPCLP